MRISKLLIKKTEANGVGLNEINLTMKPLGGTVALVGVNGAGKSRILSFVENYINRIDAEKLLEDHITNIPDEIFKGVNISLEALKKSYIANNKKKLPGNSINNLINKLRPQSKAYVKVVNNEDLINIKNALKNNATFNSLLSNSHFTQFLTNYNNNIKPINEFEAFNSSSTVNYINQLTDNIIRDEFNLFVKNRDNPSVVSSEIKTKDAFKLFEIFKKHLKLFLGKEFSYQQSESSGNQIKSILHFNDKPFNIDLLSPGQKTLFAYAVLFYFLDINSQTNLRESIIIIDEPEKHLHPEAQITLIKALKKIISKKGQLWIATHSVHILSHLEYDEIIMVKNDSIILPSRTTPGNSFNNLMGLDNHIEQLKKFIFSISEWAYGNFMVQCFKQPEVVFDNNKKDPQFQLFKKFIEKRSDISVLDYGAGEGRIGYTINEDIELSKYIKYSAYQPEDEKVDLSILENTPNIESIYSSSIDIPENTFDFVLLCNVLHEINPKEWVKELSEAKRVLKPKGYLLLIEDKFLPKGETAHEFGYLIFGSEENKILMNTQNILELKLDNISLKERISFNAFQKEDIAPNNESVINSIKKLKLNSFKAIKELRGVESEDISHGRMYANQTQLHINTKLALEALEKKSKKIIKVIN